MVEVRLLAFNPIPANFLIQVQLHSSRRRLYSGVCPRVGWGFHGKVSLGLCDASLGATLNHG
jgi:hypothetical protein